MIKVLNLYAGIGGNRKLWENVEVTAVELNPDIARVYKHFFPKDQVIVTDAHEYLLNNYKEFDFIWSSPPCPTHSLCNNFLNAQGVIRYPDLKLYEEIIFLKHWFKGLWCVENVISYYTPLIKPYEAGRHFFWSNFFISGKIEKAKFNITNMRASTRDTTAVNLKKLGALHGFDFSNIKTKNKTRLLRNCVNPELGKAVFNAAFKGKQLKLGVKI